MAAALVVTVAASPASAAAASALQPVPGTNVLDHVACSTATTCVAVGRAPGATVVVPITNGSAGAVQAFPGLPNFSGLACANATTCYAVGRRSVPRPGQRPGSEAVVVTITNGVAGPPVAFPAFGSFGPVACATATTCYLLTSVGIPARGVVVTLTNGVPVATQPFSGAFGYSDLACPSATTCYAVGASAEDQGGVVTITNGVPGAEAPVPGTGFLGGVACSSAATCYATGTGDDFFSTVLVPITSGTPGPPRVDRNLQLGPIACMSATTCEAAGFRFTTSERVVVPIVNGSPGSPVPLSGSGVVYALACPNVATCVGVGEDNPNQVGILAVIHEGPAEASDCRNGGWRLFTTPAFTSQSACADYATEVARCAKLASAPTRPSDAGSEQFRSWFRLASGCPRTSAR